MSEILEKIKSRRSVRKYKPDMVPQETIDKIIEAGIYAPSGMGSQSPIIIQISDKKVRDELSALNRKIMGKTEGDPFYGAPVVLVVLVKKDAVTALYDGSLAMGNLMLAAHELGLGSCWVHRAKQEFETDWGKELLKSLGIEGEYEGIGHCILGYPEGDLPKAAERKENRVFYIKG